jgi:hypothetical protein
MMQQLAANSPTAVEPTDTAWAVDLRRWLLRVQTRAEVIRLELEAARAEVALVEGHLAAVERRLRGDMIQ